MDKNITTTITWKASLQYRRDSNTFWMDHEHTGTEEAIERCVENIRQIYGAENVRNVHVARVITVSEEIECWYDVREM